MVSTELVEETFVRLERCIIRRGRRRLVIVASSARREAVSRVLGGCRAGRRLHDGRLRVVVRALMLLALVRCGGLLHGVAGCRGLERDGARVGRELG